MQLSIALVTATMLLMAVSNGFEVLSHYETLTGDCEVVLHCRATLTIGRLNGQLVVATGYVVRNTLPAVPPSEYVAIGVIPSVKDWTHYKVNTAQLMLAYQADATAPRCIINIDVMSMAIYHAMYFASRTCSDIGDPGCQQFRLLSNCIAPSPSSSASVSRTPSRTPIPLPSATQNSTAVVITVSSANSTNASTSPPSRVTPTSTSSIKTPLPSPKVAPSKIPTPSRQADSSVSPNNTLRVSPTPIHSPQLTPLPSLSAAPLKIAAVGASGSASAQPLSSQNSPLLWPNVTASIAPNLTNAPSSSAKASPIVSASPSLSVSTPTSSSTVLQSMNQSKPTTKTPLALPPLSPIPSLPSKQQPVISSTPSLAVVKPSQSVSMNSTVASTTSIRASASASVHPSKVFPTPTKVSASKPQTMWPLPVTLPPLSAIASISNAALAAASVPSPRSEAKPSGSATTSPSTSKKIVVSVSEPTKTVGLSLPPLRTILAPSTTLSSPPQPVASTSMEPRTSASQSHSPVVSRTATPVVSRSTSPRPISVESLLPLPSLSRAPRPAVENATTPKPSGTANGSLGAVASSGGVLSDSSVNSTRNTFTGLEKLYATGRFETLRRVIEMTNTSGILENIKSGALLAPSDAAFNRTGRYMLASEGIFDADGMRTDNGKLSEIDALRRILNYHIVVDPVPDPGTGALLRTRLGTSIMLTTLSEAVDASPATPNGVITRDIIPPVGNIHIHAIDAIMLSTAISVNTTRVYGCSS